LTGIAFCGRFTRRRVGVERSGRVNRLFGNGSRHGVPPNGWQSAAGRGDAAAPALETSVVASAATTASSAAASAESLVR
jgi:hypothetical protein